MDMKKYAEAIEFAAIAHDGAYRKGTTIPYITHVVEAGLIAMTMTQDDNTIIAAILHDIVEDTSYELNDIQSRFGQRVAELVSYESEDKMKEIPAKESWKIRKEAFLKHLENAPLAAKIVCLADKLSNMRMSVKTFAEKGDDMWLAFNQKDKKEQEWYYRSIYQKCPELEDTDAYREYVQCCDKVFSGQNDDLYGSCTDSNLVMYEPLVPEEERLDWLQSFVECELKRIAIFFDDKKIVENANPSIPGELAKPYVFLSNAKLRRTYGRSSEEEIIKELEDHLKAIENLEMHGLLTELIEYIIRTLKENGQESIGDYLDEAISDAEHQIFKSGTDEDKKALSKIMKTLSKRKSQDKYKLGEYLPGRHQIIIYYHAIKKEMPGFHYLDEEYKAELSSVLAHEYFHAMHHVMKPHTTLWKNTSVNNLEEYQKTEIKEALADFFSVYWCIEQKNEPNADIFRHVAEERFYAWRKHIYSTWPYAMAIYLLKENYKDRLPHSLGSEEIRIGKKSFSELLKVSIETPENAYAVLRKRQ